VGEEEKGKRECWLKSVWLELMGRTNEREKEMIPPLSLKFLGLGLGDSFFFLWEIWREKCGNLFIYLFSGSLKFHLFLCVV